MTNFKKFCYLNSLELIRVSNSMASPYKSLKVWVKHFFGYLVYEIFLWPESWRGSLFMYLLSFPRFWTIYWKALILSLMYFEWRDTEKQQYIRLYTLVFTFVSWLKSFSEKLLYWLVSLFMQILKCDHSNESNTKQHFPVVHVLLIMLYKVVLTLKSVNETLKCDNSHESYWAILSLCCYTVVLTFESVDEILWCDHSHETSISSTFTCYC